VNEYAFNSYLGLFNSRTLKKVASFNPYFFIEGMSYPYILAVLLCGHRVIAACPFMLETQGDATPHLATSRVHTARAAYATYIVELRTVYVETKVVLAQQQLRGSIISVSTCTESVDLCQRQQTHIHIVYVGVT